MVGCNFHSEDTGERCACDSYELDPHSDSLKCFSCDHSEKVHSYTLPSSTQQKPLKKPQVMKLLQSLGRSGQFNEANEEANKNLISKKACFLLSLLCLILPYVQAKKNATSSFSAQVRKSTSSRKGEFHDSPTESTFPVAQVALFFVGLELDVCHFYLSGSNRLLYCIGRWLPWPCSLC